jgi:hypothetical protein
LACRPTRRRPQLLGSAREAFLAIEKPVAAWTGKSFHNAHDNFTQRVSDQFKRVCVATAGTIRYLVNKKPDKLIAPPTRLK